MYALKLLGLGIASCSMGTAAIKVINFDCSDTPGKQIWPLTLSEHESDDVRTVQQHVLGRILYQPRRWCLYYDTAVRRGPGCKAG